MKTRFELWYLVVTVVALALLATSASAHMPTRWGNGGIRVIVPPDRFPLQFQINDTTATGASNMAEGSDPLGAIKASLAAWQMIPSAGIRFADLQLTSTESPESSTRNNLITMADSEINNQIMGGPNGALAKTGFVFELSTGRMLKSDIIFNPKVKFSTNLEPETFDFQSVATHELGHALGLDHAAAQNDTMFWNTDVMQFFRRYLSVDSIAFASFTYPNARSSTVGTISGRVTQDGNGIFGASVTAMHLERNLIYTTLSEPDGTYTIVGPVPGRYVIYAEPLDGPADLNNSFGRDEGSYYKSINTSFRTKSIETLDLSTPAHQPVRKTDVDLSVNSGAASLNINRMGKIDLTTGAGFLGVGAIEVKPGETVGIVIGGPDTWKVESLDDVAVFGTGVTIDRSRGLSLIRSGGRDVGMAVVIRVAADAVPGPRIMTVRVGEESVASTGGIVVTARSLPVRKLWFPYLNASPEQYTGVALANSSSTPAVVRVLSRDNEGNSIYDQGAIVPAELSIPGGGQTARLERQLFNLPESTQQTGSMVVESDGRDLQGFFLAGNFNGSSLDGAEALTQPYRELYFTDVLQNSQTSTEIHLMNVKTDPLPVELSLVGADGRILSTVTRTIAAGGKIGEIVSTLFSYPGELSSAHVKAVAAEDALAGFGLIRQSDTIFGISAQPLENAAAALHAAHLVTGNFGLDFRTRFNIVNVGQSAASVSITVFDDNGQVVPTPNANTNRVIPPGGHLSFDAQSFFGFAGRVQGSARILGAGNTKLLGNFLFGDRDPTSARLNFGAALPLAGIGLTSFLFSQVAQSQGIYTGVAFLAPEGADLRVEAFREDGSSSGSRSLTIGRGARIVASLEELIPTTRNQLGGYVKVTSNKALFGFELFGSADGRFLSAVPPQPIRPN